MLHSCYQRRCLESKPVKVPQAELGQACLIVLCGVKGSSLLDFDFCRLGQISQLLEHLLEFADFCILFRADRFYSLFTTNGRTQIKLDEKH